MHHLAWDAQSALSHLVSLILGGIIAALLFIGASVKTLGLDGLIIAVCIICSLPVILYELLCWILLNLPRKALVALLARILGPIRLRGSIPVRVAALPLPTSPRI